MVTMVYGCIWLELHPQVGRPKFHPMGKKWQFFCSEEHTHRLYQPNPMTIAVGRCTKHSDYNQSTKWVPNGFVWKWGAPFSTSWFDTSSFSHCKWQWNMSRLASCHCLVISQDFTDWGDQGFWWSYFAINHQFWSIILWPHKTAVKSSMCHSCFVIGFYSSMIIYPNYLSIIKVCKNWGLLYHPFWPKLHQIDRWSCAQLSSSNAVSQRPQRPQALIPRLKTTEFLGLTMWRMFGWVS